MEKISKFSKTFLYITCLSGILWFGAYVARLVITYQLFMPKDFLLKSYVNDKNLYGILYTISSSVTLTFILFIIFIVSFIIFLLTSKVSLKKEGWLFVSLLIIAVTAPFELYLMTIDYKIITKVFYSIFDEKEVLGLFIKRLKLISGFSLIEIFSYIAIIGLFIFQPLKMKEKNEIKREGI